MTRKTALPEGIVTTLPQLAVGVFFRIAVACVIGIWGAHIILGSYGISPEGGQDYLSIGIGIITYMLWHGYAHYRKLTGILQHIVTKWNDSQYANASTAIMREQSPAALLSELARITDHAIEAHRMHMHLRMQLSASQHALTQYQSLTSLHGDMRHLFTRIADYTHMLEETIARRASISSLHEAFDELSEHSFNLQLFIAAFERMHQPANRSSWVEITDPTHTLSRVLVPLASALDRRAMQLSSLAWNERVRTKVAAKDLELIIWLMLLGTVRYAEEESTLVLSCEPAADGTHTIITCLVSELAPAAMSPHERAAFMHEKQKYKSAHMFAHTLAESTNLMLANQLAGRANGALHVHARSQTSCLIELVIPC